MTVFHQCCGATDHPAHRLVSADNSRSRFGVFECGSHAYNSKTIKCKCQIVTFTPMWLLCML